MELPKLPIGIQHFEVLRHENYVYIDKTEFVYKIANHGGAFFLSRPRRFGKSLFVHTLAELAAGKRTLFDGLWIADKWDWTRKYPVLHFKFAEMSFKDVGLNAAILKTLRNMCAAYEIIPETDDLKDLFTQLLTELSAKAGKIVLLIDEYDKPIIQYMEAHKMAQAIENQEIMRNFYGPLKDKGDCLHLTFITGVSKFTKVSLFSEVNHLRDLTLDKRFATAFGYTQTEVETHFEPYIQHFIQENPEFTRERLLEKVKTWYNGYSWDGETSVYNPFGLLNFFEKGQFQNYWFSTGTPLFLQYLLLNKGQTEFENIKVTPLFLEQYNLETIQSSSLLFQTGYLTVVNMDKEDGTMTLNFPNLEVRESFYQFIISYLGQQETDSKITVAELRNAFHKNDLPEVYQILCEVFEALPYDVYKASNEALYHGLIHILFMYMGINIESEVHTKRGRLDAVVQTNTHVYIFEFKFNKTAEIAITQLKKRGYADKFRASGKTIVGIGLNFMEQARKLEEWIVEEM
jgi:Predicted AAA-ATPase/PD-(D/E)XK nuclease superfamily